MECDFINDLCNYNFNNIENKIFWFLPHIDQYYFPTKKTLENIDCYKLLEIKNNIPSLRKVKNYENKFPDESIILPECHGQSENFLWNITKNEVYINEGKKELYNKRGSFQRIIENKDTNDEIRKSLQIKENERKELFPVTFDSISKFMNRLHRYREPRLSQFRLSELLWFYAFRMKPIGVKSYWKGNENTTKERRLRYLEVTELFFDQMAKIDDKINNRYKFNHNKKINFSGNFLVFAGNPEISTIIKNMVENNYFFEKNEIRIIDTKNMYNSYNDFIKISNL